MCNVAISRYAVAKLSETGASDKDTAAVKAADLPLVRAALKRSGVTGIRVSIENDFPVGAGLGGSSAASAALLSALAEWRGVGWERAAVAEEGRRIEVEDLGVAGGRQDHYAATFGGALGLTFTSNVSVRRIPLSESTQSELVARSVLIYTGQSRVSGDTISAVLGAYEQGDARVVGALRRMREIAEAMASALERGNLDDVGALLNEHWLHQRSLHPSIPTERIDEIITQAHRAGALGAKAMGASGGGCVLIMAPSDDIEPVRKAVARLGELLPFGVDTAGLTVKSSK